MKLKRKKEVYRRRGRETRCLQWEFSPRLAWLPWRLCLVHWLSHPNQSDPSARSLPFGSHLLLCFVARCPRSQTSLPGWTWLCHWICLPSWTGAPTWRGAWTSSPCPWTRWTGWTPCLGTVGERERKKKDAVHSGQRSKVKGGHFKIKIPHLNKSFDIDLFHLLHATQFLDGWFRECLLNRQYLKEILVKYTIPEENAC